MPDTIATKRLRLRAPDLADAAALQQLANNKTIHKFLARLPHPYTKEHALDFITNLARTKDEHAYAILTRSGEFIGVIGLHLNRDNGPELGYWLGQPYWGQGYASEAARALVSAASQAGYSTIFARSISANKGSICVLAKVGFVQTAEGIDNCGQHQGVCVARFRWEKSHE
ncbi:hypothetical protein MNBD_ALPHA12-365 [hydrothermal vent metagenome]|uniref:N-acetyltransferase domain-containing protein n=1 Tax=hydrothermal vent metagenome TaxID=652676 RepID=A0A3B0U374_9ZZZZ